MNKVYIGIDNGVTGSIGMLTDKGTLIHFASMPTVSKLSYTKTLVRYRTRVDFPKLVAVLGKAINFDVPDFQQLEVKVLLERPMINSFRFQASISASAALEATLIAIEDLGYAYEYCDSKSWQKLLLPKGLKGADQLKLASREVGSRLFPQAIGRHADMDGILIAEWARRSNL